MRPPEDGPGGQGGASDGGASAEEGPTNGSAGPGPEGAPEVLPIFPLTGSLLLPGGLLPLHIFEPRYLHMVEDALTGDRVIGMIQPALADPTDNRGPEASALANLDALESGGVQSGAGKDGATGDGAGDRSPHLRSTEEEPPAVYSIGCVGKIEKHQELPHDRLVIVLRGLGRFAIEEELHQVRGYRRVRADYGPFVNDTVEVGSDFEGDAILEALADYVRGKGLDLDLEYLQGLSGLALLNGLAMALPFAPAEKQALLEAPDLSRRRDLLLALLGMGFDLPSDLTH